MNVGHASHRGAGYDVVATIVRSVPVRLVEVSRGGCRFECGSRLESGTSGLLAVELAGLVRIDDFRVARCQQRMGGGAVYQVGAEWLSTRRLGRRTVRMAVTKIVSDERRIGHAHRFIEAPSLAQDSTQSDVHGRFVNRGPPASSDSGF